MLKYSSVLVETLYYFDEPYEEYRVRIWARQHFNAPPSTQYIVQSIRDVPPRTPEWDFPPNTYQTIKYVNSLAEALAFVEHERATWKKGDR